MSREYFDNINEAREYLEDKKAVQKDVHANRVDNDIIYDNKRLIISGKDGYVNYELSDTAWNQLVFKCGIPASYAKKIPDDLLQTNIHRMLPKKTLVYRTESDKIRGIVTPSYKPVDHLDLLPGLESFFEANKLELTKLFITDDYMRWTTLPPKRNTLGEVRVGWDGINGETGWHPGARELIIEKTICTNGMVLRNNRISFYSMHKIDPQVFIKKYWEFDYNTNGLVASKIEKAITTPISIHFKDKVEKFMKKHIDNKDQLTMFMNYRRDVGKAIECNMDLIDNVTDYAKQFSEHERREAEVFAGSLL